MLSRGLTLFAVFSLATVFACSSARNTGVATDGGAEGGSIVASEGGTSQVGKVNDSGKDPPMDAGDITPSSCAPGSVTGFVPQWIPPTPLHQTACSPTQITTLLDCLLHTTANPTTCDAFSKAPANTACQTCAASAAGDASLGPLIISADGLITMNVAGCIGRTANQMTATGCGAKVQAASACANAACEPSCPVPDGDAKALADRNKCQRAAATGPCATFQSDADTCSQPLLSGGASAACANGSTFEDLANSIVTLFCG